MKELATSIGVTGDKNIVDKNNMTLLAAACGTPAESSEASSPGLPSGNRGRVTALAFSRRAGSALFCVSVSASESLRLEFTGALAMSC